MHSRSESIICDADSQSQKHNEIDENHLLTMDSLNPLHKTTPADSLRKTDSVNASIDLELFHKNFCRNGGGEATEVVDVILWRYIADNGFKNISKAVAEPPKH